MSESSPNPDAPRFLLPEGCKDLIDALTHGPSGSGAKWICDSPVFDRVHQILGAIVVWQYSHPGEVASLKRLIESGAVTSEDLEFLKEQGIKYTPNAPGEYHGGSMFEVPAADGCHLIGTAGPELPVRSARLFQLGEVIERLLQLPRPPVESLLMVELSPEDGVGIAPGFLVFTLQRPEWRSAASAIKGLALEHGLHHERADDFGRCVLTYQPPADPSTMARATVDLLRRGLNLKWDDEIAYRCGALEQR